MVQHAELALPEGYQLLDYRILRSLSSGGFSTVYLAQDVNETQVAIKEYLPNGLVVRSDAMEVQANTPENVPPFRHGMKCFFEEGRTLAQINHPNVVRVEFFSRQRDRVFGHALHARENAGFSYSLEQAILYRKFYAPLVLEFAQRPARSSHP